MNRPVSRPTHLDEFLTTDPRDAGCGHVMEVLHVYAELVAVDAAAAAERFPEVAAHLRACGPCVEDLDALLEAIRLSAPPGESGDPS